MPTPSEVRHSSFNLLRSVSVSAPAVRIVAVEVCRDNPIDEPYVTLFPVLALRSTIVSTYSKRYDPATHNAPKPSPSHATLISEGWSFEGQEVRDEILIHHREFGLVSVDDGLSGVSNTAYRVVACPWPVEEDWQQVKGVIEELQVELGYNAKEVR